MHSNNFHVICFRNFIIKSLISLIFFSWRYKNFGSCAVKTVLKKEKKILSRKNVSHCYVETFNSLLNNLKGFAPYAGQFLKTNLESTKYINEHKWFLKAIWTFIGKPFRIAGNDTNAIA